jgi:hypothetical protein
MSGKFPYNKGALFAGAFCLAQFTKLMIINETWTLKFSPQNYPKQLVINETSPNNWN